MAPPLLVFWVVSAHDFGEELPIGLHFRIRRGLRAAATTTA